MLSCLQISAHNVHCAIWALWDCDNLFAKEDRDPFRLDVVCGPGKVVSKLLSRGDWRAIVNKRHETTLTVEVVQEGYW